MILETTPIFKELQPGDIVQVHDYRFYSPDAFEYVSESSDGLEAIGGRADKAGFVVARAIVTTLNILDMLQSEKCVCGSAKNRRRSHCSYCYHLLPPEMQKDLYKRFRRGYEAAFLETLDYLCSVDRTTPDRILAAVPVPTVPAPEPKAAA